MRHPDTETLAAFVDGRLSGAARDRVVAHLADCDACHQVMTDAVHVLRDPAVAQSGAATERPEEAEGASSPTPGRILRPSAERFRRVLPLAAALAAAALVAALVWTPAGRWILAPLFPSPATVAELAVPLSTPGAAEPGNLDRYGWPVERGDGSARVGPSQRAFRVGVRTAELHLDLGGSSTLSEALVSRIRSLLADEGSLAGLFSQDMTGEQLAATDRLLAETLAGTPDWYALGRWAGVARVAVDQRDLAWFSAPAPRRTLRALRGDRWPPEVGRRLEHIASLAAGGVDEGERSEVATNLSSLMTVAGGSEPLAAD